MLQRTLSAGFVAPCLPSKTDKLPSGSDWLHEIKIDGYRAQLHVHDGHITVYSRSGYDWTQQFSQIAEALKFYPNSAYPQRPGAKVGS